MPVSGLMLTLDVDPTRAEDALRAIGRDDRCELGQRAGRRQAAVIDTPDEQANRRLWRWLNDLPGIEHVDVVFVSLDAEVDGEPRRNHSPEQSMQEVVR